MVKWVLYADTAEELRAQFVQYLREQALRRAGTHRRLKRDQTAQRAQASELTSLAQWLHDLEIRPTAQNPFEKPVLVDMRPPMERA